jgi:hypothetical protein
MNRVDRRFIKVTEMELLRNVPTAMKIFQSLNISKQYEGIQEETKVNGMSIFA